MNDWVSNIKNLWNSRFQRIVVISVVRNKFTVIALNKNIKIQHISNLRSEVHLLSIECQSKIILKSESVEEISLHNDFLLDLGEPNLLIMIVIFSILCRTLSNSCDNRVYKQRKTDFQIFKLKPIRIFTLKDEIYVI